MQTRFLLGPSGSGKTFRCIVEARAALQASPEGAPLVFLSPKQATFQLERQLLADSSLAGYTRLRILSFERLAEYILTEFREDPPQLLSDEGRLMVLRALLSNKRDELRLFRATARLRGFAQQLSVLLSELQRARLTPEQLLSLSASVGSSNQLDLKLQDLASMLRAYLDWLQAHALRDEDQLLSLAAEALNEGRLAMAKRGDSAASAASGIAAPEVETEPAAPCIRFEALWFDGFAELAPQEMEFLTALLPCCDRATLAFNLDRESVGPVSWLSAWSMVGQTCRQLQQQLAKAAGIEVVTEWLDRDSDLTRFAGQHVFQHLERHWSNTKPFTSPNATGPGQSALEQAIRVAVCANPEAEATLGAREILRFVRAGGRYREAAVIVRNLDSYAETVQRVFTAYEIPFFVDRREPVGHHPFSELTRSALRTVAFHWQPEDWFGALKTGLVHPDDTEIDRLENEALARGWKGDDWLRPLKFPENPALEGWLEPLRADLVAPFQQLDSELGPRPSGSKLAAALASFWQRLGVAERLQAWSAHPGTDGQADVAVLIHGTIWQLMQDWLESLALAFASESLSLREWLPVLEAGLASQTVGVIPPNLDQVLVGAIDRSRNPDLKVALVLGMNESVFPAPPEEPALLTAADREQLAGVGIVLGSTTRHQLAQERYLGYIACTRARQRLVITCALRDEDDRALNPSPFIDHLQRLFPDLKVEMTRPALSWPDAEHVCELAGPALRLWSSPEVGAPLPAVLQELPDLARLRERFAHFQSVVLDQRLSPGLAERLYGTTLETSVSRLEEYAACPFKFAMTSGLHLEERKLFRVDVREQGSFQHEILARFHQQLLKENKRWRDLTGDEARARVASIADQLIPEYQEGLFKANQQSQFTARALTASLQEFIGAVMDWMPQYQFDPHAVELAFGIEEKPLPAWEMALGDGHHLSFRGKIDRVDLWRDSNTGEALCVVMDYKSSARKLDPLLLAHGIQLQLPAYLNVLRALKAPEKLFGVKRLIPAGVFFVNLRGRYHSSQNRTEVLDGFKEARAAAYQHTGRFDLRALPQLDGRSNVQAGDQFNYRLRKDGQVYSNCREALNTSRFEEMLDAVEGHLRRMGREIYAGVAKADPYRKGTVTACQQCPYQPICRIDPWTHAYRVLQEPVPEG